ncbi:MAG: hypothetical protein ACOYMB_01355 [Patescibacteria group bacterium]
MRFNPSRFNKSVFIVILLCGLFWLGGNVKAAGVVAVSSDASTIAQTAKDTAATTKQTIWQKLGKALAKAGSGAFQATLRTALNKIAVDTATWIGSGADGQKPLFVTKDGQSYLGMIADEAAGQFIESFADSFAADVQSEQRRTRETKNCDKQYQACDAAAGLDNDKQDNCLKTVISCEKTATDNYTNSLARNASNTSSGGKASPGLNLCAPSLAVRLKLSLGLVNQARPARPNCAWSDMKKAWDVKGAYEDLTGAGLSKEANQQKLYSNLRNMFDTQSSDLSVALVMSTSMTEDIGAKTDTASKNFFGKGGWLDSFGVGGDLKNVPGAAEEKKKTATGAYIANLAQSTGDAFVDASNIFLNQLAKSAFDNFLNSLNKGTVTGGSDSKDFITDGNTNGSYDYLANQQALMSTFAPNFKEQTDYDVLSKLATCQDQKNPSPDECVIDSKFMDAISAQKTVGEALNDGALNKNGVLTANSTVFDFNEKYSLRNAIILRKFRIIPVGWEEAIRQADEKKMVVTLGDMISCFSPTDKYTTFKSPEVQGNQAWCRDLIDPNWVLKVPQTRCAKAGFGNQILSMITMATGTTSPASDLVISRADDYCADERTCINETKGVCDAWGYCTADRRTWDFNGDSCDQTFNSCETFSDVKGRTVSYLKNTLDYGDCDASNSGCRQYSTFGSYASSTNTISWSGNNAYSIFLNEKAISCDSSSEGCRSLVRVKPTWGDNLIFNNNFDLDPVGSTSTAGILNNHWQVAGSAVVTTENAVVSGSGTGKVLGFTANSTLFSDSNFSVIPENSSVIDGYYYTLSAEVYAANGTTTLTIGAPDSVTKSVANNGSWQAISLTAKPSDGISSLDFSIVSSGAFYLRKIKLEANNRGAGEPGFAWSNYGDSSVNDKPVVTQEKLIPEYLSGLCYKNPFSAGVKDYRLKDNAPDICNNFARLCNKDEVGCQTFSSMADDFKLTAKVNFDEYCPDVCVGYDSYVQRKTNFQDISTSYFIPKTATNCTASSAGCSRFTNLDSVTQGGESNEYYSALRRCIQPDNTCGVFYSWSSEDESGYQLKSFNLVATSSGANLSPKVYSSDSNECSEAIFKLPAGHPDYNPDCRQFYNKTGGVSYHLYSKTISCTPDCRKLRLDETVTPTECTGNGGEVASSTCVFRALPSQSSACGEAERGCREYNGSNGNNINNIATYDFESNSNPFSGAAATSSISINKNGKSLKLTGVASTPTSGMIGNVTRNSAYYLKFLAKATDPNANLKFYFENASGTEVANFNSGVVGADSVNIDDAEWKVYQVSLPALNHRVEAGEKFVVAANSEIYLDSLVVTEVTDRYYLIKDSWVTDDSCYYDLNSDYRGPEYNLGCSAYQDPYGTQHNLRQFSSLCDESSAGCEAMIDTRNSKSPFAQSFASSTINVLSDKMVYAIFNPEKECSVADIGCSRLGEGKKFGTSVFFSDVFLINNPDNYEGANGTLCQSSAVGCETFFDSKNGKSFFRNPGDNTCRYRASSNVNSQAMGWFKEPVKRCKSLLGGGFNDVNAVCASDADCHAATCALDTTDRPCDISYFKTIGNTGAGAPQPSKDAGLCETAASGCSEYIDATSAVSPNMVMNPTLDDIDKNGVIGDMWIKNVNDYYQDVYLKARKLYIVRSVDQANSLVVNTLGCTPFAGTPVINVLDSHNNISTTSVQSVELKNNQGVNIILKYDSVCRISSKTLNQARAASLEVREAVVEYQKEDKVDLKTCNSKVDFDNGCVLFNNRAYNGIQGQVSSLSYNAFASTTGSGLATSCSGNSCNANMVVKVSPNRVCSRWLSCTTAVMDEKTGTETCYGLNECDKLTEGGGCGNFVGSATSTHVFNYAQDKNATGYSLLNAYNIANMKEVGATSDFKAINFEDNDVSFDLKIFSSGGVATSTANVGPQDYTLADEPSSVLPSMSYPAEGKVFVGIKSGKMLGKSGVNLIPGINYYISYLVNTDGLSGPQAMVKIVDDKSYLGTPLQVFKDTTKGWQRVVHKINVQKNKVAIVFGTSQALGDDFGGTVYYDDIKIEPVLEINNHSGDEGNYLAKECRLYPTEDSNSLTCSSRDQSVVKNGWEGYCLQHDPLNPGVCLQWLPLDNILSSSLNTKKTSYAGRGGTYPLYYCAEANAQFDLVENRITGNGGPYRQQTDTTGDIGCQGDSDDYIPTGFAGQGDCLPNYNQFFYQYSFDDDENTEMDHCETFSLCVPDTGNMKVAVVINAGSHGMRFQPSWGGTRYVINANTTARLEFTGNGAVSNVKIVPVDGGFYQGPRWGSQSHGDYGITSGVDVYSAGWYKYDGLAGNESAVRVYDYNNPTAGLWYINSGAGIDPEDIFTPTCNKFVEVVDSNGIGKPWMERIFSEGVYPTSTSPNFFPIISEFGYSTVPYFNLASSSFGQVVSGITAPYGAASLFNTVSVAGKAAIKFGTMFNNNSNSGEKSPLAGRPYGCSDNVIVGGVTKSTNSCQFIGYCKNKPEINCVMSGNSGGTTATCAGSGVDGPCVSYGFKNEDESKTGSNQKNTLKNIFLDATKGFLLNGGNYIPDNPIKRIAYDSHSTSTDLFEGVYQLKLCSNQNSRPNANSDFGVSNFSDSDFCAIMPKISNVSLFRGNGTGAALTASNPTIGEWTIAPGYYTLKFNSIVDKEQQPLGNIIINWGDDQVSVINTQDNHPAANAPHAISHNYSYSAGAGATKREIKIKVTDNWGLWKTFPDNVPDSYFTTD